MQQLERLRSAAAEKLSAGDPEGAAVEFGAALRLWRGPALADVADAPFAQLEAPRLEQLRLLVTEDLLRARLASGHGRKLLPELEALVEEQPLREGLRELLMVALYRAGRQADALAAYRASQRLFRQELGLEPSPRLRDLEQAILRQDPSLEFRR